MTEPNIANNTNIDRTVAEAIVSTYRSMMNTDDAQSASWVYSDRTYDLIPTYPDGKTHVEFKITILDSHKRRMTLCDIHDVTGLYVEGNGLTVVSDTTSYTVGVFGSYVGPVQLMTGTGDSFNDLQIGDKVFSSFNKNGSSVFNLLGCTVTSKTDGITFQGPVASDGSVYYNSSLEILSTDTVSVSYMWYLR